MDSRRIKAHQGDLWRIKAHQSESRRFMANQGESRRTSNKSNICEPLQIALNFVKFRMDSRRIKAHQGASKRIKAHQSESKRIKANQSESRRFMANQGELQINQIPVNHYKSP
jgi:hypothetical protein